jgi:hypothetical protein
MAKTNPSSAEGFHLVCDRCELDNGPVGAVRKTKFGYVPGPCSCGHSIFRLHSAEERAQRDRRDASLDDRQMRLAL